MAERAAVDMSDVGLPEPSERELETIIKLVYERTGITLTSGKRSLVTTRLQKRLRELSLDSYGDYLQYLDRDTSGQELVKFIDAMATNHTWFFREEQHFQLLGQRVLPELLKRSGGQIRGWCAASSTGEEPYTIVVSLLEAMPSGRQASISLLASDISTKALRTATNGVYPLDRVKNVPLPILRKYFERGQGDAEGLARVAPHVRRLVEYRRLNLLEIGDLGQRFDFIFCRNVMIYFDKTVQQRVVNMLERHLAPGGYLFIAHSEGLMGITHQLTWVAPAAFQRRLA
ncbi:MAG: protein-glutamate O-methyltransferase CheR [Vicinamibacterales bacterium]